MPSCHRCTAQRVLLHSVLTSQEEYADEICHQSEAVQPVGGYPSLQDGGYLNPAGPTESQGIMVKVDLKDDYFTFQSIVPEVHSRWQVLPILVSSIQPVLQYINGPTHPNPYQIGSLIHRLKVGSMMGIYKDFSCTFTEQHMEHMPHVIITATNSW